MAEEQKPIAEQPQQPGAAVPPPTPEKKKYTFKFAYSFIFLDYFVRWVLYGLWQVGLINGRVYWLFQILLIPALIIFLTYNRQLKVGRKYKIAANNIASPETTLFSVIFSVSGVLAGTYISYVVLKDFRLWVRILSVVLASLIYGFYIAFLYVASVREKAIEDSIPAQPAQLDLPIDEWVDENDLEIIRLQTDQISLSQRVDTYTLESTLFGALSFSGFVTIIASEKQTLAGVRMLITDVTKFIQMFLAFDFSSAGLTLHEIVSETTLIAAIAVETLICSIFFLSVIVSRIRFTEVLKNVDYAVRIASAFNDKEEEVYNLKLQTQDAASEEEINRRLQVLKTRISNAVYHAEEYFRTLTPIVNYMWVSRNLGLLSFLLILITGALWVAPMMAFLFTSVAVLALGYTALDGWVRRRNLEQKGLLKYLTKRAGLFQAPVRMMDAKMKRQQPDKPSRADDSEPSFHHQDDERARRP